MQELGRNARTRNITGTVEYLLRADVADLAAHKAFHTEATGMFPQVNSTIVHVGMGSPKGLRA